MRTAVAIVVGAWLVLAGCSTAIEGSASVDQRVVATGPADDQGTNEVPPSSNHSTPSASTGVDTSESSSSVLDTSRAIPVDIPQGFAPYGYFGYRAVGADATCPPDIPDCVGIDVYSVDDCPAGATIVLDYYKEETNPTTFLAEVTGTTPPITSGGIQSVFIAIPEDVTGDNPYGYINSIKC